MNLRTAFHLAALSIVLVACASSSGPAVADDAPEMDEHEVSACDDTYARTWFVTLADRACTDVAGYRGTWIATALDSETPSSVCTMAWQGDKYSRADMDALRAFVVDNTDAMVPACSGAAPDVGSLEPIPHVDNLTHAGANGCDVCGKLRRDGKITVILPPESILRQFEVKLTDGTSRAFQIHAAAAARAVSLQLPPTAEGVAYAAGNVRIY